MFLRSVQNSTSRRRRVQPLLERLEDRCVPAIRTWLGDLNEFHWNVAGNWLDTNNNTGAPQPGDRLVFPPNPTSLLSINDFPADTVFQWITINGAGYSIGGNSIKLTDTLPVLAGNLTGQNVVTMGITFTNSGAINVTNAAATLRMDGTIAGSVGLTKQQAGTLILRGNNSYTGTTDIQGGVLKKDTVANIIPNSSDVIVAAGATFDLNGTDEFFDTLSGAGSVLLGNNASSAIGLGLDNGSSTFTGQIQGAGGLYKAGIGTFTLAGVSNPFTGTTHLTQGTLVLATTGPGNLAVGGPIEVGDDFGFAGDAVLRLDRNHALPDFNSVLVGSDGTFNVNGHAEFVGALTINRNQFAAGTVDVGTGSLGINGLLTCNGGNILGTGAGTITPLADVLFKATSGAASTIVARLELAGRTQIFTVEDLSGVVSDFTLAGLISGSQGLTKRGPGSLVLTAANSFTGLTTVAEGTLLLANGGNSTIVGPLDIGGSGTSVTVLVADSNDIADNVTVTVKSGGLFDVSGNQETIGLLDVRGGAVSIGAGTLGVNGRLSMTGGTISSTGAGRLIMNGNAVVTQSSTTATINANVDLGGGARSFNVESHTQIYDLVINGVISNGGFIKNGSGNLRFEGGSPNSYAGPTAVNEGFLVLAKPAGVTAVAGPLVVGDNSVNMGAVQITANDQIADTSDVIIQPDGDLQLFTGSETVHTLSMTGGLVSLFGQNVLTLNGDVTYNGTTSGATMILRDPTGFGGRLSLGGATRTFTVANGAAAVDLTIDVLIAQSATTGLIKAGPGTMTLNKYAGLGGPSSVTGGTLLVNDLMPGPVTVGPGATLGGGGTVGAATMQDGSILSPGSSVGLLATGNLSLGDATRVIIEIQTPNPAAQIPAADSVQVTGVVNLGTRARLDVIPLQAVNLPVGTKLQIISNDGTDPVVGTFANLPEGAVVNSRYRISYRGGDGNDVVLARIASYIVTGPDAGVQPRVRVFDAASPYAANFDFFAYPAAFKGGVRVATADLNGDGYPDIITAPGPGTRAIIKVFSGNTQPGQAPQLLRMIQPYGSYKGGAFVATGDVDRDGVPDIITGPGKDTAPTVKIFSGASGSLLGSFNAFAASFKGGVTVAAGDVNGDGRLDIIAGMGPGSKPRVRVFDAASHTQLAGAIGNFLAYPGSFTGGVFVAAGDVNGDRIAEVITGPGSGTAPLVKVFTPATVTRPRSISAYLSNQKKGVRVATADINGDGKAEIVAALGPGGNAEVRFFNDVSAQAIVQFFAQAGAFTNGQFVAGS